MVLGGISFQNSFQYLLPVSHTLLGQMEGFMKNYNPDIIQKAVKLYNTQQYSIKEIEELTGVKKSTLYRNLQEVSAA